MSKQVRDDIDKFHDYDLFLPTRTIWLGPSDKSSETDVIMAERLIKNLAILESRSADPITILMINPGGEIASGLAIYDAIRACKSHITIKATGTCHSMATIILQAADVRLISANLEFMIHKGTREHAEDHATNIENLLEWEKRQDLDCNNIYLRKIKRKHPDFTLKRLTNDIKFDKFMKAQEVIDLGLADEIYGEVEEETK